MSLVEVRIVGLQLNPAGTSVVILAESGSVGRALPILIGTVEAQAIAIAVAGIEVPRPGTHDLLLAVVDELDARLEEVAVTELVEGTFYAELFIESPTGLRGVSARPSDALALAVRTGVPIHVHSAVLDDAAVDVRRDDDAPLSDAQIDAVVEEFQRLLRTVTPEDFADPGGAPEGSGDAGPEGAGDGPAAG